MSTVSVRTCYVLDWLNVETVEQLSSHSEMEVLTVKHCGEKTFGSHLQPLADNGLAFRQDWHVDENLGARVLAFRQDGA